jgi:Secretory lipase
MTAPLQPTGWYPDPGGAPGRPVAALEPKDDPFYSYAGDTPLASVTPGTVLQTRNIQYHVLGIPTSLKTTQLLYRSTSQTGNPTVNVTSVIEPLSQRDMTKVISYQSAYDSLNRNDEPSYAISGGLTLGGVVPNVELAVFGPFIADGYTVIVPDTEGQRADFAAGPEYGMNTLDSIRATFNSSSIGLPSDARVALLGYSGGAIATDWAAELAPTYAPDVNGRMIGAAMGGVLVDPAHNLHYVEGTYFWDGVLPMALVGIARAFEVDFRRYLSPHGVEVYDEMQTASIVDVLGQYWGLTWTDLVIRRYRTPESLPLFVTLANKLIMGTGGTPTIPLFIGQGANGDLEWTPGDKPGIGPGDGVMIAGDVRTLARGYCANGTKVYYEQYDALSHITSVAIWLANSIAWIKDRFAGLPAPQNCSSIQPGNPLEPIPMPSPAANPPT